MMPMLSQPPPLHMPQMAAVPTAGNNHSLLVALYYVFKILPILMAGISIYLGYRLFILGVTGQASLSVESKTIQGQLINAAPGLFFAVGGIVVLTVVVWKGVQIKFADPGMTEAAKGSYMLDR